MYDIFYLGAFDENWHAIKSKFPNAQLINKDIDVLSLQKRAFTKMFWVIWDDVYINKFDLSKYRATKWDDNYVHVFLNGNNFKDGICLLNKTNISNKEFKNRFFINKKDIDIVASVPRPFEKIFISTYDDYLEAIDQCKTDMFWAIWDDVEVDPDFKFDYYVPRYDTFHRNITHIFKNGEFQDGICLFSKNTKITKKEFDHRFFINKKEIDIVASVPRKYDEFIVKTYDDYLKALEQTNTEMFFIVPSEVEILDNFRFDAYFSYHNQYDRNINHGYLHKFRNETNYNGVSLVTKNKKLSKKEIDFRFIIEKKEWNIVASRLKPYDIIFISYKESNADENYKILKQKFPRTKRLHGVKGIHQAHIKAAEMAETDMFYVVDGDSIVLDSFLFDYEVSVYERDIVNVWKSKNPINDLEYGYGGVKLLPRDLTLNLNIESPDMTTSISKKFKAHDQVSNISAFNVDEFSTWRSAFRECVKLSSRTIQGQVNDETQDRLDRWCSDYGKDRPFGKYAIKGAIAGRRFGSQYYNDSNQIKMINDFNWLHKKFIELQI